MDNDSTILVVTVTIDNLKDIRSILGENGESDALLMVIKCIKMSFNNVCLWYMLTDGEFLCCAADDALGCISQLRDTIAFEAKKKAYDIDVSVRYGVLPIR